MPLSDAQTIAIAVPVTIAIYWRRGIIGYVGRWWRIRNAQRITNLPAQIPPVRYVENNTMTPLGFERHCAEILQGQGWMATLTAGSGDQGIDVLARKGRISVVIQVKFYSKPVGNAAVQEAIAGQRFMGATHAAVVSNQPYTRPAIELAGRDFVLLLAPDDLKRADALFR